MGGVLQLGREALENAQRFVSIIEGNSLRGNKVKNYEGFIKVSRIMSQG